MRPLAVLTDGAAALSGFSYRKCVGVSPGQQKVAVITR